MLVWRRQFTDILPPRHVVYLSKSMSHIYIGAIAGSVSFVALQCELFLVVSGVAVYYELFLAALFVSVQCVILLLCSIAVSGSIIFTVQYELFLASYV